jgi:hypothetical protein
MDVRGPHVCRENSSKRVDEDRKVEYSKLECLFIHVSPL